MNRADDEAVSRRILANAALTDNALFRAINRIATPQVRTFDTSDDLLEALFGPPQHDRHVHAYRCHRYLVERAEWGERAAANVRAEADRIMKGR